MRELTTETASVALATRFIDVYLVTPHDVTTWLPVVIVIHDILGFNADTQRICQRLANGPMPLVVAAPDLYQGLGPKPLCIIKTIKSLKQRQGETFQRLAAVQSWLSTLDIVDPNRVAVVGFCIGGGFALLYAAQADVSVVAPFYGDVPLELEALRDICPVVGGYGAKDKIFAPQGHRLLSHLNTLNVEHDVTIYPDAGHSYMNQLQGVAKLSRFPPMHGDYSEPEAENSWARVFDFFATHL